MNQVGITHIIIVFIALIALLSVGGYVYFQNLEKENDIRINYLNPVIGSTLHHFPIPNDASNSAAEATSSWKSFVSKDNLYQVSVPLNWTVAYSGGSPEFGSDN